MEIEYIGQQASEIFNYQLNIIEYVLGLVLFSFLLLSKQ